MMHAQTETGRTDTSFTEQLGRGGYFQGYAYGYPHKTAYRPLEQPKSLATLWSQEDTSSLFLYVHVPFCEMRCAFCNLFTTTNPDEGLETVYLAALERQIDVTSGVLSNSRFVRMAIGGGTPTFLSVPQLERLFATIAAMPVVPGAPAAVEMSPATVSSEKLALLRAQGVTRASIGVQSFHERETRALGRLQHPAQVRRALAMMRGSDFPVMNVDLIYGIDGQTKESWIASLAAALEFAPEEFYLYPLYVRPLTGLGRRLGGETDRRLDLYRTGRDFLLARGYHQVSMRLFRARRLRSSTGPVYCCQEDGMVGLGAGARSYTRSLHYSTEWAVGAAGVRKILERYIGLSRQAFSQADYGFELNEEERRRRFVIKSILRSDGLDCALYRENFGSAPLSDFPWMDELFQIGALVDQGDKWLPTDKGLELSDVIGPWLYSGTVRRRMSDFELT